jgi:competence protein ComGD
MEKLKRRQPILRNNSGHTLTELIIALFILSTVAQITLLSFNEFHLAKVDRDFIEILSSDLMYAQQWAISNEKSVTVRINNSDHSYTINDSVYVVLQKRYFDPGMRFEKGTIDFSTITFKSNGSVDKAGTILLYTPHDHYKIVFNLGKGRFYVKEL